jgi:hypothetical protein
MDSLLYSLREKFLLMLGRIGRLPPEGGIRAQKGRYLKSALAAFSWVRPQAGVRVLRCKFFESCGEVECCRPMGRSLTSPQREMGLTLLTAPGVLKSFSG